FQIVAAKETAGDFLRDGGIFLPSRTTATAASLHGRRGLTRRSRTGVVPLLSRRRLPEPLTLSRHDKGYPRDQPGHHQRDCRGSHHATTFIQGKFTIRRSIIRRYIRPHGVELPILTGNLHADQWHGA